MAEEDKKRFELEMANYVPSSSAMSGVGRGAEMFRRQQHAALMAQSHSHFSGYDELNPPGKRGRKRTKMKRIRDPNAPKRCMSAFFWYSQVSYIRIGCYIIFFITLNNAFTILVLLSGSSKLSK